MAESLISIAEARRRVLASARPKAGREQVQVEAALDRVLATDLAAVHDVPPFSCSAMDGYALEAGPAKRRLTVSGESRAGSPSGATVAGGEAIRISTGAAVPAGASAVIRQEDTDADGSTIVTKVAVAEGENVRAAGEDMRAGTTVLRAGTRLGVAELGAAVAAGAGELPVARRPRVTVLCTGDELRAPGAPLAPGEIHNSNALILTALAQRYGALTEPAQRLADARETTERALAAALGGTDLLVISGGVSVGPHDHVKPALAALGVEERFWGVALQPGKPTWFGVHGETLVFGLPGNPVSAAVTFVLFVAPALEALQGAAPPRAPQARAELAVAVRRNRDREQALRVRLEQRNGHLLAVPNGPQGSHIVTSLLDADALAMIPPGTGELAAGEQVALELWPR